jgi:hypothetical protein
VLRVEALVAIVGLLWRDVITRIAPCLLQELERTTVIVGDQVWMSVCLDDAAHSGIAITLFKHSKWQLLV